MNRSFWRKKRGAVSIEYALIAVGISVAIAAVVFLIGDDLSAMFGQLIGKFS